VSGTLDHLQVARDISVEFAHIAGHLAHAAAVEVRAAAGGTDLPLESLRQSAAIAGQQATLHALLDIAESLRTIAEQGPGQTSGGPVSLL
jgi:hypothetical protein